MPKTTNDAVVRWVTPKVADLFSVECANERDGGISPAVISSTIDSVVQAPDIMCPSWEPDDFVALLAITWIAGLDAEVGPIVDAYDDSKKD